MPTLNELVSMGTTEGNPISSAVTGVQQGMSLAKTAQDMEMQKQNMEAMKEQLDDSKWRSAKSMLNTFISAPKPIQARLKKQMQERFVRQGFDPAILDAAADQDTALLYRQAMNYESRNPIQAAQGLESMMNASAFHEGATSIVDMIANRSKQLAAADTAQVKAAATVEAAQVRGGALHDVRLDKQEAMAVNALTNDAEIKNLKLNILQAKKDYDLIEEAKVKGLTKLKAEELVQSYVGLLKGMSARSTGAEREELTRAAMDVQTRSAGWLQKLTPQGAYKYEDLPFLEEIGGSIKGLHGTLANGVKTRLNEKMRKSKLPSVNAVQQTAYDEIVKGTELGYAPADRSTGATAAPAAAAPSAAPKTAPTPAPNREAMLADIMKVANPKTQKPYTRSEAEDILKSKGI